MQHRHTTPFPDVDQHLLGRRFRYVPHILLAGVALLGMGTHHLLLVAVGLIVLLAFQTRMHGVTSSSIEPSPTVYAPMAKAAVFRVQKSSRPPRAP